MESPAYAATSAPWDLPAGPANRDRLVLQETSGHLVPQDFQESRVPRETPEEQEIQDHRDCRELPVRKDRKETLAPKVRLDRQDSQVRRVPQETGGYLDCRAPRGWPERGDPGAHRETLDHQANLAMKDHLDLQELWDHLDRPARLENPEVRALRVRLALRE